MRRTNKRLLLSRETVRALTPRQTRAARGGTLASVGYVSQDPSQCACWEPVTGDSVNDTTIGGDSRWTNSGVPSWGMPCDTSVGR